MVGETPGISATIRSDVVPSEIVYPLIFHSPSAQEKWCALGHEQLFGDPQLFQCSQCHKDPVFERHFNVSLGMCSSCAPGQESARDV